VSRIRVAVLASGSGTTFQNLVDRASDGRLGAEVALLLVSRRDCGAVERARGRAVPVAVVDWKATPPESVHDELTRRLDDAGIQLACLGGFLKLWRQPDHWVGRVMNIHPALLPAFGGKGMYGHHVHEAVIASGVKVTGCTVHFASNEYDAGPIIVQRTVPVHYEDTPDAVAARVFAAECEAYPEAISLFAAGRLRIDGPRVQVLPAR
jgi:formyltetrahydrofolate-dependent phosphoribosylglycinamide formyltransferase